VEDATAQSTFSPLIDETERRDASASGKADQQDTVTDEWWETENVNDESEGTY
jgi:hypothetical protein